MEDESEVQQGQSRCRPSHEAVRGRYYRSYSSQPAVSLTPSRVWMNQEFGLSQKYKHFYKNLISLDQKDHNWYR